MAESRSSSRPRRDPRLRELAEESGYEILDRIGAGGMGIVYRAHDADGNDVAIKLLRHEISDDPRARERLGREVAAQKLVRNDNIVRIVDAELDSPEAFVVTEFVPGPTLEEAVRGHGGLHPEAVREIGLVLGEALRAIHASGVIHRDLKPSNVLLRGAGEGDLAGFDPDGDHLDPVIIDFGIALAAEESRMTSTGLVMGTAAYLDPEVIRTDRSGEAGDWWAWAALLAFAATGREPFGSGRADLVFLRAERGEIDLEGTPSELGDWLRAALTSDPAQRPAPEDLLARLADLDLSHYPDPGETEALDAGPRTAVLPVAGAAAAGAADDTAPEPVDAEPPTEALPAATTPAEPPTETLPRYEEEPVTEALPVTRTPTRAFPVLPPEPPQRPAPTLQQPVVEHPVQPFPAPQQQPPRQYAPLQQQQPQPMPPQPMPPQQGLAQPWPQGAPVPGAWGMPVPPPRRPLLVWTGHLLLIALAAVVPYVALAGLLLLGALARAWERSHQAVTAQRLRGATGSAPLWRAGLASPFRVLQGLVEIVLQALFPLILGMLVGIALDASWTLLQGTPPPDGIPYATALTITLLITWVGLGSRTTRNGAHRMLDAAAPDLVWGAVVQVLLLAMLGAVVFTLLTRAGMVDLFPFYAWPSLDDIALWRR
ncbi:serine/threonine-protein kinase [Brachybacterium sp. YJGR34]|uniref:serine/threonine-protein kinase n=1 Tax=Brachybacterium sp. YJGR34 TaxID=2059911 RepID=UPI000E0A993C|nr:serine/threonine-protein kinase [Brachybacterium sp. YJGR34]